MEQGIHKQKYNPTNNTAKYESKGFKVYKSNITQQNKSEVGAGFVGAGFLGELGRVSVKTRA